MERPIILPFQLLAGSFLLPEDEIPAGKPSFGKTLPRRLSKLSRRVFLCVDELVHSYGQKVLQLPVVYASRYGELQRTLDLFKEWEEYGELSPAGFSLSVHNTTASVLGLATGNTAPSSTIAAAEDTLRMGLMDAILRSVDGPQLFIYGDEYGPEGAKLCALATVVAAGHEARTLPYTPQELKTLWETHFLQ